MRTLIYHARARDDIIELRRHLDRTSGEPRVSDAFLRKVRSRIGKLARSSTVQGRLRPEFGPDFRSVPVDDYPLIVRYFPEYLLVLRFVHSARRLDRMRFDEERQPYISENAG
ncbi:type II toxin-antitoxin system RelE/ParE family toxin [Chthonobacter albigriseus]|uniref:type II toxin-antitoxin system RelE/ParE family toxin n=1 Tax=Chthonobacter albigriseus TaxID=1683161 RepID=UPI0015EEA8A8